MRSHTESTLIPSSTLPTLQVSQLIVKPAVSSHLTQQPIRGEKESSATPPSSSSGSDLLNILSTPKQDTGGKRNSLAQYLNLPEQKTADKNLQFPTPVPTC